MALPGPDTFYIDLYRENLQNFSYLKSEGLAFDIWYIASSSGPLPRLLKLLPWGQKWPYPGADMFYIDLYIAKNFKNLLKVQGLGLGYLVCSIA